MVGAMQQPTQHRLTVDGITLAAFEWHADRRGRGGTILLAHATGFHARCWDRVVAQLGGRHVIAVDQRGHGRSDKVLPVHWYDFGRDLAVVVRALALADVVGVGHSMGGHAMTQAAATEPRCFQRLILIDPVIAAPDEYAAAGPWALPEGMTHPTARRRNHWASPEAMFERFKDRPPFAAWDRAVLRDYCVHGLVADPSGEGFVLACPPEIEAAIYMTSRGNGGIYDSIGAVDVPVLVVRAMAPPAERDWMDFRYSPTWPGLASHFRHGREVYLPDQTHFLPMEHPDLTARFILGGG
jgi:lipase